MTWQRFALWLVAAGMIFSGAGACGGKAVSQNEPSGEQSTASKTVLGADSLNGIAVPSDPVPEQPGDPKIVREEQALAPGAISNEPARFESSTVTVTGIFHGWRGPCRSGPPVSRSDWMIADSSGCLYVHGPVPPGLDPAKPSGEKISVTGVVRLKMGWPYLESGQ
jgi:hypothetical protein